MCEGGVACAKCRIKKSLQLSFMKVVLFPLMWFVLCVDLLCAVWNMLFVTRVQIPTQL